ncbi:carboxylesterase family protein [Brevundimonas denitrificans]
MSGQQVTACGPMNGTARGLAMIEAAGLTPATAHALKTLPVDQMLAASAARDPVQGYGGINFAPLLDGRSLTRHPFYPDAPARSAHIPMIIGNTREETLAFMGNDPANAGLTWETLPARLTPDVMRIDIAPEMVIEGYRRMKPDWTPDQVLIGATTAGRSWRAAVIEAEERAKQGSPAWVYQLDYPGTLPNGRAGAFHTADIALAFDNVTIPESRVNGPGAQDVSNAMADAFIALARNGNPNHAGLPAWTPYGLEHRETMLFDVTSRMANDPRGDEREFFARIPYIQPGT